METVTAYQSKKLYLTPFTTERLLTDLKRCRTNSLTTRSYCMICLSATDVEARTGIRAFTFLGEQHTQEILDSVLD
jgi:hypothetical protein